MRFQDNLVVLLSFPSSVSVRPVLTRPTPSSQAQKSTGPTSSLKGGKLFSMARRNSFELFPHDCDHGTSQKRIHNLAKPSEEDV